MLAGSVGFGIVAAAAAEDPSWTGSELIEGAMAASALSATNSTIIDH